MKVRVFEHETWFHGEIVEAPGWKWEETLKRNGFSHLPIEQFGSRDGPHYELHPPLEGEDRWLFLFVIPHDYQAPVGRILVAAGLPEMLMLAERLRSHILFHRQEKQYQKNAARYRLESLGEEKT